MSSLMPKKSFSGYRYFVVMIAAARRHTRVELTKSKADVYDHRLDLIALVEGNSGQSAKRFNTENAPAFLKLRRELNRT